MNTRLFAATIAAFMLVGVAGILSFPDKDSEVANHAGAVLVRDGITFPLMVADTAGERNRGLGGVVSLEPYAGMLFVLEDAKGGGIWMKGMLIPLDILWLSEDGTVLQLEVGIEASDPRVFTHHPSTWYVLEVPAGFALEHGIGVGSKFEISL